MSINHGNLLSENLVLHYPFNDYADPTMWSMIADFRLVLEHKTDAIEYRIAEFGIIDLSVIPPWFDALVLPPSPPVVDWDDAEVSPPGPTIPGFSHALILPLIQSTIEIREVVTNNVVFSGSFASIYLWAGARKWATFTLTNEQGQISLTLDYDAFLLYTGIVPPESTLIDSTVEGRAESVRRMFIQNYPADDGKTIPPFGDPGGGASLIAITDKVVLKGGFNTEVIAGDISASELGTGSISLDMVAGAGTGKFVICDDLGIKTINNHKPLTSGDMLLTPTGNLNYERTDAADTLLINGMRITSSSNPCCSCADYITAYTALVNEYSLARRIGFRLNIIRDLYDIILGKVNQERAARETGLNIKTNMHLRPGRAVAVMTEIKNLSDVALLGNSTITFSISGAPAKFITGSGILVTTSALKSTVQVDPTVSGNELSLFLGTPLAAYGWVQYTFQVSFPSTGSISCITSVSGQTVQDATALYVRNL